jgi:hypothetical protein
LIQLFKRSPKKREDSHTVHYEPRQTESSNRKIGLNKPVHNNRKRTHGRKTQYVDMGDGTTRAIFHNS